MADKDNRVLYGADGEVAVRFDRDRRSRLPFVLPMCLGPIALLFVLLVVNHKKPQESKGLIIRGGSVDSVSVQSYEVPENKFGMPMERSKPVRCQREGIPAKCFYFRAREDGTNLPSDN